MELHLEDAKLMKSIIDPMIPVGEDLYIEITEEGFRANCKGIANAWAADAVLRKSNFASIDIDEKAAYYVKLKDFADFMKTVQNNDTLTMRENEETGSLDLILKSEQTKMTKKIAIRLQQIPKDFRVMDMLVSIQRLKEHPAENSSSSDIQNDLFSQAIKAAELGGNEVQLTNSKEGLNFEAAETNKKAEAYIAYDSEYVQNVDFKEDDSCEAIYKLDYLRHISRIGKSGDILGLTMLNSGPLMLIYSFQEGADDDQIGYIGFAIAPRVKSDE